MINYSYRNTDSHIAKNISSLSSQTLNSAFNFSVDSDSKSTNQGKIKALSKQLSHKFW